MVTRLSSRANEQRTTAVILLIGIEFASVIICFWPGKALVLQPGETVLCLGGLVPESFTGI